PGRPDRHQIGRRRSSGYSTRSSSSSAISRRSISSPIRRGRTACVRSPTSARRDLPPQVD
ncbi:MAG: hypothetical protein ACRD3Q_02960, partial [Terriglobales bacterium]